MTKDGFWKPGSSRPSDMDISSSSQKDLRTPGHKATPPKRKTPGSSGSKTKLSGSTMNMRFMQRSNKKRRESSEKDSKEVRKHEPVEAKMEESASIEMDCQPTSGNIEEYKHPLATAADVYGISEAVVGRRSFGGFNKPVEETWKKGLERAQKQKKPKMSEEELVRRYEKYLNDSGDLIDNEQEPIGGLAKKRKGRRNGVI